MVIGVVIFTYFPGSPCGGRTTGTVVLWEEEFVLSSYYLSSDISSDIEYWMVASNI